MLNASRSSLHRATSATTRSCSNSSPTARSIDRGRTEIRHQSKAGTSETGSPHATNHRPPAYPVGTAPHAGTPRTSPAALRSRSLTAAEAAPGQPLYCSSTLAAAAHAIPKDRPPSHSEAHFPRASTLIPSKDTGFSCRAGTSPGRADDAERIRTHIPLAPVDTPARIERSVCVAFDCNHFCQSRVDVPHHTRVPFLVAHPDVARFR